MADETDPESNVDLLLKHLKAESLATKLVRAHGAEHPGGKTASMKAALEECLEQARKTIDGAAD